jgi:CopG family transcriptional regulator, nickel-responsive regulator
MSDLVRLSISIEKPLHDRLEDLVRRLRYENRSEFIRDLVRSRLVEEEWEGNLEAVATITLVYNHHARRLSDKLTDLQHDHFRSILAVTHVHLDEDRCAEAILVRGKANAIRELAGRLQQQKGVLHAAVSMSTTGKQLS